MRASQPGGRCAPTVPGRSGAACGGCGLCAVCPGAAVLEAEVCGPAACFESGLLWGRWSAPLELETLVVVLNFVELTCPATAAILLGFLILSLEVRLMRTGIE